MSQTLPVFRFDRDPVGHGGIVHQHIICAVCGKERDYAYTGNFHAKASVKDICPWCIADGSAAGRYDGSFHDCYLEEKVSEEDEKELMCRTPGHASWQPQEWPVHCGAPCAFVAPAGMQELEDKQADVSADLRRQTESYGLDLKEFSKLLADNGPIQGYLFQCVHCGAWRLTTDCD